MPSLATCAVQLAVLSVVSARVMPVPAGSVTPTFSALRSTAGSLATIASIWARSTLAGAAAASLLSPSPPPQLTNASGAVKAKPLGRPSMSFRRNALSGASSSWFFMLVPSSWPRLLRADGRRIGADR